MPLIYHMCERVRERECACEKQCEAPVCTAGLSLTTDQLPSLYHLTMLVQDAQYVYMFTHKDTEKQNQHFALLLTSIQDNKKTLLNLSQTNVK